MLADSDSEANDIQFTINEHYAKAYAAKKEREELGICTLFHAIHSRPSSSCLCRPRSEGKVWLRCRRG